MKNLSGNPYEGARRAFFILNHNSNDEDWENWQDRIPCKKLIDLALPFAELCRTALELDFDTNRYDRELIIYSVGWFESIQDLAESLHKRRISAN